MLMEKWQKKSEKGWKSGKRDINKVGKVVKIRTKRVGKVVKK